jgi:hypothetical protein
MLSVGHAMNRVNPHTGMSEFWFDDWRNRMSDFFAGSDEDNNDLQTRTEGAAARGAYTGIKSDITRGIYDDEVSKLHPFANEERARLKAEFRQQTPPEVNAFIKDKPLNARHGSVGRANVTNPVATENARTLGRMGRGAGVLGVGLAAADIATAENPYRAAVANAGALGGGIVGGTGGALMGAATGPGAVAASPILAATGSLAGGQIGYRGGESLYDFLDGQYKRWTK